MTELCSGGSEVSGSRKCIDYVGMLQGLWPIRATESEKWTDLALPYVRHIFSFQEIRQPPKPNLVTVRMETAPCSKTSRQTPYPTRYQNIEARLLFFAPKTSTDYRIQVITKQPTTVHTTIILGQNKFMTFVSSRSAIFRDSACDHRSTKYDHNLCSSQH